jgi:alkylated DNA nucleotide flippase Atl1
MRWDLLNKALAELPAGSWTTYGDLAAFIGSHAVPVGMHLASQPAPNAHRVLQVEGTVSPGFRWPDPDRTDDPRDLLREEGIEFDDSGRANPAQRVTTEELAVLAGVTRDETDRLPDLSPGQDETLRDSFLEQLRTAQSPEVVHGVLTVLTAWSAIGGTIEYGRSGETSCFLMARGAGHPDDQIWPIALYPTGRCEVVFQHMASRAPFDDPRLREELRQRLNEAPGVDLPAAKLELRPAFDLRILADATARNLVIGSIGWFFERSASQS